MAKTQIRVFGSTYQGPRGLDAFDNDSTPTVEWNKDDGCWYLSHLHHGGPSVLMHVLAGGEDDEEAAVKLADSKLASIKQRQKNLDRKNRDRLAKTLPLRTFHTGKAFYHAGRRCLGPVQITPVKTESLEWPASVNFAFAAEAFMKALLCLRGKESPRTHELDVLFEELTDEDKAGITALYVDKPLHPKIEDDIEEAKDYFEDLRYYHEHHGGYWHDPAARFADRLYRYTASVIDDAKTHGDPYP
jgi:HEPN domain-containing protein